MNHFRQYKIYRHKFRKHLQTAHGVWCARESIILRQEDENGIVSFGELCPTPGFVSYQLSDFIPLVEDWKRGGVSSNHTLLSSAVSCMRSGIWNSILPHDDNKDVFTAELFLSNPSLKHKDTVYKMKIGIQDIELEIETVFELFDSISSKSMLRLDANESLTVSEVQRWNDAFRNELRLQFLEQPLPRNDLSRLIELDSNLDISLALDESLVWKDDLDFFTTSGWNGFYVVKPTLFSDWNKTINFIKGNSHRTIVSTVFESPFGFEAVCRCASFSTLTAGLDRSLFNFDKLELSVHHHQPIEVGIVSISMLNELWDRL